MKDQEPCQEVEKRLGQKSMLSVVTEAEHQINCELSGFDGRKGNYGFHQRLQIQRPLGRHCTSFMWAGNKTDVGHFELYICVPHERRKLLLSSS